MTGSFSFSSGVPEDEQVSSFQNATLHQVNDVLVGSIAIFPHYPKDIKTEEQARKYLSESLAALISLGWEIEVQVGHASCTEDTL